MKTSTLQDPSVQYDWEKHASAVLSTPEIERAFGDQAYSRCAQRAQKLMQPPYFLGFEMIYANEDKTRLVGIFAFRINKDLIYIPSFFLNGQVKGQELLYQVKQKKMKPCTEEWISYLMEKAISEPGMGIARTRLDRLNTGTDLKPLIMPMRNKIASSMGNSEFIKLAREEHGQEAGQFVEDAFTRALAFEDMLEKRAKYGPSPSPSGKVPESLAYSSSWRFDHAASRRASNWQREFAPASRDTRIRCLDFAAAFRRNASIQHHAPLWLRAPRHHHAASRHASRQRGAASVPRGW